MTTNIQQADLIESVAAALQFISYYHPADYIAHLARAYEREASPAARDAIAQILTNSRMCAEGHRPICQDTGIVVVLTYQSHARVFRRIDIKRNGLVTPGIVGQQAGGAATNGHQRILDLQPTQLHERVSVILGSKNEVERVTSYHAQK